MNTIEGKVNKIILGLTSVGIVILLMFPASLSADHFRYGTMSWELVDNDTIRFNQSNGWTNTNSGYNQVSDFTVLPVAGFVGSVKSAYSITWGGGGQSTPHNYAS